MQFTKNELYLAQRIRQPLYVATVPQNSRHLKV